MVADGALRGPKALVKGLEAYIRLRKGVNSTGSKRVCSFAGA